MANGCLFLTCNVHLSSEIFLSTFRWYKADAIQWYMWTIACFLCIKESSSFTSNTHISALYVLAMLRSVFARIYFVSPLLNKKWLTHHILYVEFVFLTLLHIFNIIHCANIPFFSRCLHNWILQFKNNKLINGRFQ